MKRVTWPVIMILFTATACGTLNQNLQARKNLSKCKYDFEKLELKSISLKGLEIKSVNFIVYLKITNTASGEVALDHVEGDILLDEYKTSTLSHKRLLRIKAGQSAVEGIDLEVPFKPAVKALGHKPDSVTIAARLYMNILIGSFTLPTPVIIQVKKKFPIPYDKIEDALMKQTKGKLKKIF